MSTAPAPAVAIDPCFAVSRKDLVTTSLGPASLWATAAQGIPTEVFWPSPGEPQIKDLGFIIATAQQWVEVKAQECYTATVPDPRVPVADFVHTGPASLPYHLTLRLVPDPRRDALLIEYDLSGVPDAAVFAFCAARLRTDHVQTPPQNWAWTEGGRLFACTPDEQRYLCLDAIAGFSRPTAGSYGFSDVWHDFAANGRMTWQYDSAGRGPVVVGGELAQPSGVLVLAFAGDVDTARGIASASLTDGAATARSILTQQWQQWGTQTQLPRTVPGDPADLGDALRWSATTIKVHQDRGQGSVRSPGGIVASMSRPWGDTRSEPGYFLVWPRDSCESALALIALGHLDDAQQLLDFLIGQQSEDGHWRQNFFPDGTDYWSGVQLDETALPVLLAATLADAGRTQSADASRHLRDAVAFLARIGPRSQQDRWEEDPGASPFTVGVAIAALIAGAPFLTDPTSVSYALDLADFWNERLEELTYVQGSYLDVRFGGTGHYVRVGPGDTRGLLIKNRETDLFIPTYGVLGMEFAYLARLGLRSATDPRLTDTVRLVDALLARRTGAGTTYLRYSFDGYGELIDGANWDNTHGLGRPWPILAGERGVYEVAAGRSATDQLRAMLETRTDTGYIPEQVWDQPPIPRYPPDSPQFGSGVPQPSASLYFGRPSLSATPLVWGHAELVKLACARAAGKPLEILPAVENHLATKRAPNGHWRSWHAFGELPSGRSLYIEDVSPFQLSYRLDDDQARTVPSSALPFGLNGVVLSAADLAGRRRVTFRLRPDDPEQQVEVDAGPPMFMRAHSDPGR